MFVIYKGLFANPLHLYDVFPLFKQPMFFPVLNNRFGTLGAYPYNVLTSMGAFKSLVDASQSKFPARQSVRLR